MPLFFRRGFDMFIFASSHDILLTRVTPLLALRGAAATFALRRAAGDTPHYYAALRHCHYARYALRHFIMPLPRLRRGYAAATLFFLHAYLLPCHGFTRYAAMLILL